LTGKIGPIAFMLVLYFVAPIFLAKMVVGASWMQILIAYAVFYAVLFLVLVPGSPRAEEGIGWMFIMAMFLTIPAVPILCILLRVFKVAA
jgi:hypothetical protein